MFRKEGIERRFRWMLLGMGIPMLLSCMAVREAALFGQRVISTVDPAAQGMDLKFDINEDTTDDIAPNILFNASGTHGMVAYTGSGTIIAFNPQDGKITSSVKTGGRPSQIVLTPDGKLLFAADAVSNRIFAVDIATFTLKATYTFTDAEFGFGNNIVFSADGKTGYITTFRYDPKYFIPVEGELIRFNVADGKEAGTRLKVGQSPTVITLSPDKKTIAVVNVDDLQSTNNTDTVSLVDVDSFSVRATVLPNKDDDDADTDPEIPADFSFLNNVSFSKDGGVAIISNRVLQSQLLATDIAYVFQVSDGKILATPEAGITPSMSATTPDGKYFYLLNEFGYNVVDTTTYAVVQGVQSPYSGFGSNSNISFRTDSSVGFIPSQDTDGILGIKLSDGGILSALFLTETGATRGGKKTLQVQATPDGKMVCALNFTVNTLQCAVDTYSLELPGLDISDYLYSGFSIINTTDQSVPVKLDAQDLNSTSIANDEAGYNTGQDATVEIAATGKVAQSFQPLSTSEVVFIRTYIRRIGIFSNAASLKISIQTDNGSGAPSGTVVTGAVAEILANQVGTDIGFQEIRFAQSFSLTELTTYWIVLEGGGTYSSEYTASTKALAWGVDGSDPTYSSGQFSVYAASWTADSAKDGLFSIVISEVLNPKDIVLAPGEQVVSTQEYFNLDDRIRNGRIRAATEKPALRGYWVHGSRDMATMDGIIPDEKGHTEVLLPEIIQIGDEETGFNTEQDSQIELTASGKLAQSFQLEERQQIDLIKLYLIKTGTFTSDAKLQVTIQADAAGVPSGVPLENATLEIVPENVVYTVLSYVSVRFEGKVNLEANTTYWIVLEGTGTYSTEYAADSKEIDWGVDSDEPVYTPGQFATYSSGGWTADSAKDALFTVVLAEQVNLSTSINFMNRYHNYVSTTYELYDGQGNQEQQSSGSLPGLIRMIQDMTQLFSSGISDRQGGYMRVIAAGEINAYEQFGTETSSALLPAITLDDAAYANSRLYFPRVAFGPNIQSIINVINLSRQTGYATGQDELAEFTASGKLAQSFRLEEAGGISLVRVLLKATGDFSETAAIKATIQEDSAGKPSGTPLDGAKAEIAIDDIQQSLAVTSLHLDKTLSLKANTTYWLVLEGSGTYSTEYVDMRMTVEWGVDSTTPTYTVGQLSIYADSAWTAYSSQDALFEIVLSEDNEVTLSLYSSTGVLLAPPYETKLAAGGQLRDLLANLFPSLGIATDVVGWVLVESSKPGIVGDVIFSNVNADYLAAGLLQTTPMKDILFAQVAQGFDYETGWLLLNAGDSPADVRLELHDTSGAILGTRTLRLNGRNSLDLAFQDVFPRLSEMLGGYLVVRSSQPLYSFSLMNNNSLSFLCAIPPQAYP